MRTSEENKMAPARGRGGLFVNVLGILLAFGAAFGGMFLVRECLLRETEALLGGSGEVLVPFQSAVAAVPPQEADWKEAEREKLTEAELFLAVEGLNGMEEVVPHEPRQGQMAMAQAIEAGREWMEEFFLPHLGIQGGALREYKINCYLWSRQADGAEPLLSYWSVSLGCQELNAALTLDAVSGQVLAADVAVSAPVEYQDQDSLRALLEDYADSLGVESHSLLTDKRGGGMYQSVGGDGVYAALRVSNIAVAFSSPEAEEFMGEVMEVFSVHLYLDNWNRWVSG